MISGVPILDLLIQLVFSFVLLGFIRWSRAFASRRKDRHSESKGALRVEAIAK